MVAECISVRILNHLKDVVASPLTAYLLTAIIAVVLIFKQVPKRKYRLPPGPIGFPIVGYAPFLGKQPHEAFYKLSRRYGNLISCYLGNKLVVVANDFNSVKEILGRDEFLNRPEPSIVGAIFHDPSVVTVNGNVWKEQRRFTLHQLRDLGFGKNRLEECIQEEISYFVKELMTHDGKPPDLQRLLAISMANNIRFLVFGHRTEYDDPKSNELEECTNRLSQYFAKAQFELFLPSWVTKLFHILGFERALEIMAKEGLLYRRLMEEEIDEHKKTFQEDSIRDLVDSFLLEMKKREQDEQTSFNDDFLLGNTVVFFSAGSDTTKTTLSWLMLLLAIHQDVQQKAYEEIIEVIGKERMPNWSDHTSLPYCKAVIAESQRMKPIAPLNLERSASGDTTFLGYDIPKDATILTNLWAVQNDPTYWSNPEKFDPTRFLSEDGKIYFKSERVIPFSGGRRSCPGETMANVEILLYLVSMLQHFQIRPKDGYKIDIDGVVDVFTPIKLLDSIYFKMRIDVQ